VPPVIQGVGVPVIDMPGCVEAHELSATNRNLTSDDPKGTMTFCDAGVPSFNPLDYNKEKLKFQSEAPIPVVPGPKDEQPSPKIETKTPKIDTVNCLPTEIFDKETNKCITRETAAVVEEVEIPWTEQYLPAPGTVTTTASIAFVATTSALMAKPLADLLLKLVKPTVKKVVKKIAKIRGKVSKVESLSERRISQRQRNLAVRTLREALKPKG
jgi:hypothetical protein